MAIRFPPGFLWGAATASYQIEGGWRDDGKGESIWDRFSHTPGKVQDGDTGDVADDHYHRWQSDIELMKDLGLNAYRFSTSWPRVLPNGYGKVEPRGLDFYSRLVDGLLDAGVQPWITLYHWDLPQALEDRGGWPSRETAFRFAEYAEVMARRLGDRVKNWITLNEPFVAAALGYYYGIHAPGRTSGEDAAAATHHLLLGHGYAAPVIRRDSAGSQVGITLNYSPMHPATDSEEDHFAAQIHDAFVQRVYLDPLAGRPYPHEALATRGFRMDMAQGDDMTRIATPIDFLGLNNYSRDVVAAGREVWGEPSPDDGVARTEMGWEVYPQSIYEMLMRVAREYPFKALYVTENGAAFPDRVGPDGQVDDPRRVAFLRDYISQAGRALAEGAPLKGYFVWSLLDNFEWAFGLSKRFGLYYVDYGTLARIPKSSAKWYRRVIAENAVAGA
ncbi:MAG: GH1 family beta-glucosidase [Anaerolineae bacterium]|nr:GH1 family beta-glucosidase [Anaerolineae bacterium]